MAGNWLSQQSTLTIVYKQFRQALAQSACQITSIEFWYQPFHFFELISKLFQSKPTQATIFEHFFDFELQSTQTWTQIRTTIRARAEIELEFELELLLLLRSAHARRRLQEPSDTGIGSHFQVGGPPFLKRFSEGLFSQKWCQMEPKMASKRSQNLIKNKLETKSTKHVGNVPNLRPSDLQETRFRMERLSKSIEPEVQTNPKNTKKCVEIKPKSMKNRPQNSTKNDA